MTNASVASRAWLRDNTPHGWRYRDSVDVVRFHHPAMMNRRVQVHFNRDGRVRAILLIRDSQPDVQIIGGIKIVPELLRWVAQGGPIGARFTWRKV